MIKQRLITKFKIYEDIKQDTNHVDVTIKGLQVLAQMRIYHWQAEKVGQHNIFDDFIDEKRKEFGDQYPFNYSFLEEDLDEFYKAESIIGKIFRYFTILTIFIASLGLLGLSAFMAQQRTREIGIRKVVGSSITGVVMLFVKDFSIWIGLANLLAWPLAWFAMTKWLQDFQYKVDITIWLFVIAFVLSWLIAILTISWQSIKAANTNPAESLKYE